MALFRDKMKNWKPGRMVRLKPIVTDGVLMKLVVYPNGIDSDCAGHVSIAIENSLFKYLLVLSVFSLV